MGNSAIYWYPAEGGPLERLDFGECISDLQPRRVPFNNASGSDDGEITVTSNGAVLELTIVNERMSTANQRSLISALRAFEVHAKAGKPFGFAVDSDKAWAAYTSDDTPSHGKTQLDHDGNVFIAYNGIVALATDDFVHVESLAPSAKWEEHQLTGVGSSFVTLSRGLYFDHVDGPCLVRHADFFPVLYLAPNAVTGPPIITSDFGRNWTLSMTVRTSVSAYRALLDSTGGAGFNLTELDDAPIELGGTLQERIGESKTEFTELDGTVFSSSKIKAF